MFFSNILRLLNPTASLCDTKLIQLSIPSATGLAKFSKIFSTKLILKAAVQWRLLKHYSNRINDNLIYFIGLCYLESMDTILYDSFYFKCGLPAMKTWFCINQENKWKKTHLLAAGWRPSLLLFAHSRAKSSFTSKHRIWEYDVGNLIAYPTNWLC